MSRAFIVFLLALTGCAFPEGATREEVEAKGSALDNLSSSRIVKVVDEPYMGARAIPLEKGGEFASGVFARRIILNKSGTLEELCATVGKLTGLTVAVEGGSGGGALPGGGQLDAQLAAALNGTPPGAPPAAPSPAGAGRGRTARIAYEGSVKGLLDVLGARFGLAWEYSLSEGVVFAQTAIRTFTIIGAPGAIKFSNNITNQSKDQTGGGGSAGVGGVSSQETSNQTSQSNSTELSFDIWKDVETGIKALLSSGGSVVSNQAAGTVTVKDTGASLRRIEKFMEEINERLARQIALSIKVWSLEMSDSMDAGLNLGMFFENPDVRVFAGSLPLKWQEQGGELSAAIVDGKLKDSTALLKALRSVGQATQVTSGGGVVMSNQPVPVQAVKREAYLAGSSVETTDYGQTSTLTPGEITTGFAMTVIPHILEGRRVVLQYTVNLSQLDDLAEFSSGDSKIQLPKVSTRSFSQRMTLKMGQTLVLAGFEQEIDGKNVSGGIFGIGKSRGYKKSLIVITISTESGEV